MGRENPLSYFRPSRVATAGGARWAAGDGRPPVTGMGKREFRRPACRHPTALCADRPVNEYGWPARPRRARNGCRPWQPDAR